MKRFVIGDLVRIIEDPMSHVVSDILIDKLGIVISFDDVQKIYTVVINETNQQIRLLDFMLERAVENNRKIK